MLAAAWLTALVPPGAARAANGDCGQPVTNFTKPVASDALGVLRAAVGSLECLSCVCDVDSSGGTNASDALRTLRFAVGTVDELDCLACLVTETIGPGGGLLESADHKVFLNIPPGALAAPQELTIEEVALSEVPESVREVAESAYALGPDSLIFNSPVELDVVVRGNPVVSPTQATALLPLLVGVDGNETELLPVQQLFVEIDQERMTAGATLSHFSQLAIVRTGVAVSLADVPEAAEVGDPDVSVDVEVFDGDGGQTVSVDSATYTDNDFGAWAPSEGGIVAEPLVETMADRFQKSFDYGCASQALVVYRPQVHTVLDVLADVGESPQNVPHLTVFEKTILCENP
ncbi:MAG TPA: hypothetical protein VEC57_11885 [Candidatus Limnocylindrales bacterium]|nr:hypothetical protein [Candidatus Limnocylindrales bacterium]